MGGLFHRLRHPRRCYMVCATSRSGSNLLTDGLHATRKAGRPKQFFLRKFEAEYGALRGLDAASDFAGYVRGIIEKTATSNEVFGFKVMGWYLGDFLDRLRTAFGSEPNDRRLLESVFPRLKFIQVVRGDKVRQAVSKARALQSGLWKVQEGNAATAEPAFDPDLIARCQKESIEDEALWNRFFDNNNIAPHVVTYEHLCSDYAATVRSAVAFLGVRDSRGVPERPSTVRQADALSEEWTRLFLERGNSVAPSTEGESGNGRPTPR